MGNIERVRERKREREGGRGPEAGKAPSPQLQLLPMSPWARGIQPHNKENSGKHRVWERTHTNLSSGGLPPLQLHLTVYTLPKMSCLPSQSALSSSLSTCNKSGENICIRKVMLPICQDRCSDV